MNFLPIAHAECISKIKSNETTGRGDLTFSNWVISPGPHGPGRYKQVLVSGLVPAAELANWDFLHLKLFRVKEQ
jgi:hypothetical protein